MRHLVVLLSLMACNDPSVGELDLAAGATADGVDGDVAGGDAADGDAVAQDDADDALLPGDDAADGTDAVLAGAGHADDQILVGTFGPAPKTLALGSVTLVRRAAFQIIDGGVYGVPDGMSAADAVTAVQAAGVARYAELDHVRTASAVNDPLRGYQWHLNAVYADAAWAISTGAGVVVAVVDTGVSASTADGLTSLLAGWDYVNNDANASDDNGHGTHVASTIGERTNNGVGAAGLAYGASILPVKVLDAAGSGYTSNEILGVQYAVSRGAKVINLSLGSSAFSQSESDAMTAAYNAGVVVVAASGNDAATSVDYPAAYPVVVAVGATGFGGVLAPYSNTGSALDIVAPGGNTSVDANGDGYGDGILQETLSGTSWNYYFYQGTSMATPQVAAVAAMLVKLGATNAQAVSALTGSATDLGTAGWDGSFGYGLVRADAALNKYLADAGVNRLPTAAPAGPYTGTAGVAVSLSGAGSTDPDGTIASWVWSFGDGTTGSGATVSKTWSTAGTYTVSLTVTDNKGGTSTATTTATIAAASSCTFSGSVASGASASHVIGTLSTNTIADRWLRYPTTSANLDFYLESASVGSSTWSAVAKSTSTTKGAAEHITYKVTSKLNGKNFRWRVLAKSGSSSYCIGN